MGENVKKNVTEKDAWLDLNAAKCIRYIDSLPPSISPNDVVRHFNPRTIRAYYIGQSDGYYHGFGAFVKKFLEAGGDAEVLAQEFLKEFGYPENEDDLVILALLVAKGAKSLDANKIVDALTPRARYYNENESVREVNIWFYDMLLEHLDDAHKAALRN